MNRLKYAFLSLLFVPMSVAAQPPVKDSIPPELIYSNFDRNLDSLMQMWYVQESIGEDTLIGQLADDVTTAPEFNDSIYIARLRKIPSVIPLTYNNVVRNYIHVYTIRNRAKLEVLLGMADYYFPMIEEVLDTYGVPQELRYLAVIESALNPRAVSRMGATGMWQFMLGTGRLYGLRINSFVDERRDPMLSTQAAARYLKDLHSVFGDWVLALAAYNCGAGNVNKAIRRSGGKTTYWDIYPYLPRETRGYVPAYIGATYAMNYYREHNLAPRYIDVPPVADTVMVNRNINLAQVADVLHLPLQQLRDLNPQYRRDILPGEASACMLRLPAAYTTRYIDMEDSICRYKSDVYLSSSFRAVDPAGRSATVSIAGRQRITHRIRQGETLGSIAERYGVRVNDLREWNDIYGSRIRAGRRLTVYVRKGSKAAQDEAPKAVKGQTVYYTVKDGDTLWSISRLYEVTTDDIREWNNLSSSGIKAGMKLKIIK